MFEVDLGTGGCRWMTSYEHSYMVGSKRVAAAVEIACCHCKLRVPYTESWVTVAFGTHGNRLPLPTFLHCYSCSLILDAEQAYRMAWAKDQKAAEPDPVKVEREAELNRLLSGPITEPPE